MFRVRLLEICGYGSDGVVWIAIDENTGSKMAVKRPRSPTRLPWRRELGHYASSFASDNGVSRETLLWSYIPSHVNVTECLHECTGCCVVQDEEGVPVRTTYGLLFMEYGESITDTLRANMDTMSLDRWMVVVRNVARGLGRALVQLHAHGILHRDVRLENVLLRKLDAREEIRGGLLDVDDVMLCDFSMADWSGDEKAGEKRVAKCATFPTPPCSTIRAPEQFFGDDRCLPASDIWSLGCVVLELIMRQPGEPVFDSGTGVAASELRALHAILDWLGSPPESVLSRGKYTGAPGPVLLHVPSGKCSQLRSRVESVWWNCRSATEVELAIDWLSHALDYDYEMRFSAESALEHPWLSDDGMKRYCCV